MRRGLWFCAVTFLVTSGIHAAAPFDTAKRELWTTSKIVGSPDPAPPYVLRRAFANLKFDEPLELQIVPGGKRWLLAERKGKIFTFADDPQTSTTDLLLDLKRVVYGVACHPQFAKNGFIYVTSVPDSTEAYKQDGTYLSRFTVTEFDPPRADPQSEVVILKWPSGGHNGGCVRFGPDGMLYLATGDGSGIADQWETGQDLSDLLGAMLRIDVDRVDGERKYAVPQDNPFVGQAGVRGENWAYGLRQVWKFSFDRNQNLWAGEVGQDLWDSVLLLERGGNYGWSINEGAHPFRPQRKPGPTPIIRPIVEHPHSEFRSITGGYVYYGKRLPELTGQYIYGDYDTGRVWALRYDGKQVSDQRELADTQLRIVAFGENASGELYALDFIDGTLHELAPSPPPAVAATPFPQKLSETGLFASTKDLTPAAGLIPYSVNAQLWSDGASKERFLAIPGDGKIEFETVTYPQPAPGSEPGWRFPDGTVMVKTFFLDQAVKEGETDKSTQRRRLETRILHVERVHGTEEVGDQVWRGYTYVWNDEQTDAELCDKNGADREFTVRDPAAPDGLRKQKWHFPSRTECTVCHTVTAKYTLGVNTAQLNRVHDYGNSQENQLAVLDRLGVFTKPLPKPPAEMAKLADYKDEHEPLDRRARAYFQANCSHCHRKWGGGNAEFQLLHTLPLAETGAVGTIPGQGTFELKDPRILVPGEPDRSLVLYRMQKLGLGRMPHIASNVVDEEGAKLIRAWIESLGQ